MFSEKIFSQRLHYLRKISNITLQQLGDHIGLTKSAVGNLEHGRKKPSIEILQAIAEYFEVPTDFLLGRGVFENWEEILDNKPAVIAALTEYWHHVFAVLENGRSKEDATNLFSTDILLIKNLHPLVRKIVFTEKTIMILSVFVDYLFEISDDPERH